MAWSFSAIDVSGPLGFGIDGVADPDVDLHAQPRRTEMAFQRDALSAVHILFADWGGHDGGRIERHTVGLDLQDCDLREDRCQRVLGDLSESEKIHVASGPDHVTDPRNEKHGAFEHETLGVTRTRDPVQKPFGRVARENQVRIDAQVLRLSDEPRLCTDC